ncbi:N-acetylmuramoyl-L-alanine amidase [Nocardiopsis sp. CNR-923]|uniref:peptidoglycan recognition protein family protein n=1 Tax=Nocardiopsis sp. CNR-923 TaxID=1904965 RepID=UPI00096424EA|nr:N-acetylmuramoyl-L-alanine amidase [Nocardiopsis sp. CNR-923]OLT26868.1 N-acetylmuramoyl-L-alanine amidase [Nocardiopsis sp. CNR-923]
MRRRSFLTGSTALAGLTALGATVPARGPALAGAEPETPRVMAEPSPVTGGLTRPRTRFDVVTVTRPMTTAAEPAIRFETAGVLGDWTPVHLHSSGREDRDPVSSAAVRAPEGATGYEVRGGARAWALNLSDGETLRLDGPTRTSLSAPDDHHQPLGGSGGRPSVRFVTRAGWGADESYRFDDEGNDRWPARFDPVQALTVHHTALATSDDHAADVRAVYHLHAVQLAWGDIGYHALIDPDGVVYEGRHSGEDGAPIFSGRPRPGRAASVTAGHTHTFNHGNIGVCLLGDFTDELPTRAARDSLVDVLRLLCAVTGADPGAEIEYVHPDTGARTPARTVSRHRDWLDTECPGNAFSEVFDAEIRQRVVRGRG